MPAKTRFYRFLIGLVVVSLVLTAAFAITLPSMHRAGATDAEVASVLPGDELLTHTLLTWTVAKTVNAPAAEVYPWLIQIGDTRGGYYSYTFIEHLFDSQPGLYVNADRIHPEWQAPERGIQGIIANILVIQDYKTGEWVLAKDTPALGGVGWSWLWIVEPIDAQHSRLINRFRIQTPQSLAIPGAATFLIDIGGFVMEQNMMQGIVQRAEGGRELTFTEPLEILLWLTALGAGFAGAWFFITRPAWQAPLTVSLAAVAALFVLTFVQPPLFVRALIDLVLVSGAVWSAGLSRGKSSLQPVAAPI